MQPEPKEYSLQEKWDAIGRHMLSNGMENADLGEKLGGLHKDTVRKARNGTKPFANPAIMESIPPLFGASGYDELIAQANAMPDMSPEKVMDAIYRTAAHKEMHLNEVVERSGYTSKLFSFPTIGTKAAHAVATKAFELPSVARMVSDAANYPEAPRRTLRLARKATSSEPEVVSAINDAALMAAMIAMQHKRGFSDSYMAEKLGLTRSQYMTTISSARFQSDEEREKLPRIFRCRDIDHLIKVSRIKQGKHWTSMLDAERLSQRFGNPTNTWERD